MSISTISRSINVSYPLIHVNSHRNNGDLSICPGWFSRGHCEHGHIFIKQIYCGKEWCPICGRKDSEIHKRRIARILPKIFQIQTMGYFVFTIPIEIRDDYRSKNLLSWTMKMLTSGDKRKKRAGILESFGFTRGISRWHFFGDRKTRYNPHLNVLVDGSYVSPHLLSEIKKAWGSLIGYHKIPDVRYSYRINPGAKFHSLKYITRSTFLNYEWDPELAKELFNFRNIRYWGCWDKEAIWTMNQEDYETSKLIEFEKGICPLCKSKISWDFTRPSYELTPFQDRLLYLTSGYFLLDG